MLKKALLCAVCATSFCFADNFLIDQYPDKEKKAEQEEQSKLPQRVVIEDVNPSSELGQLIGVMLKNEQKKAVVATPVVVQKPKTTVKKKKTVKKKSTKKKVTAKKNTTEVKKEVVMEIKSEEATKVSEPEKKEAEHNENNSSLKKVSSSKACD